MPISTISTGGIADSINIDNGTLVVDGVNNRVGIGTSSPSSTLDVEGSSDAKITIRTGIIQGTVSYTLVILMPTIEAKSTTPTPPIL